MRRLFLIVIAAAVLAACASHSGSYTPPATTAPAVQSTTAAVGTSAATVTFPAIASGVAGTFGFPAATAGSATATLTLQSSLPSGDPAPQLHRVQQTNVKRALAGTVTPLAYVLVSVSASVTIAQTPSFAFTFPSGLLNGLGYVLFYDPTNPSAGWQQFGGPVSASGTAMSFSAAPLSQNIVLAPNVSYVFALVQTGIVSQAGIPADCPAYTPAANGVKLNITDDAAVAGAQLLVYIQNGKSFLSTDGTFDSGVPVGFPAPCYSTTVGSAGTQPLLVPSGVGGRIYFVYAPYTAGATAIPTPFAGGSISGPPGAGGGMRAAFPWDVVEYGTTDKAIIDTTQVDALGLPLELAVGATPLPVTTPGALPTPSGSGAMPAPCATSGTAPQIVGITTCNFVNVFNAMQNTANYNANVLAASFPSSGSSALYLRVISAGEAQGITAFPWDLFADPNYVPSPVPAICPSQRPYGYISCVLASYAQQPVLFTSLVPGAGSIGTGPDHVTGDYYCASSDGSQNFIFTNVGKRKPANCNAPLPSPDPAASPTITMNVYNFMYGVPPLIDNGNANTCKPAILLQQPWGLANVNGTTEAKGTGGHLFANDDAFGLWKGLTADFVYGSALNQTQTHPVGAVTPAPPVSQLLGELFQDPMYDRYDYILHTYFDGNLSYGLAYDDLYGMESGLVWRTGDPIDVRINAIPVAPAAITPPFPAADPSPCPVLTPGIGTF